MTDIAVPDQQPATGTDLRVWAEQATAAAIYAERVCSTLMAPAAYRGKPAEACAAILAGAELGFSPMRSLNAFDNIQGTPAPKAITLRALVQAAGHEIRTVESSPTRAVVAGRRRGDSEWQTSTWDIERAQLMPQFKTNPNYKTNPAAMLIARATAEVCRWVASDAIMGVPYAAEELDGEHNATWNKPIARKLTVAALDAPAVEMIDDDQRGEMFKLWDLLGYEGDANREMRLQVTAKILGLNRELESSDELTNADAARVIDALHERLRQAGGPQDG